MSARSCQVVILAAGEGKRMRSAMPKVMHPVAGLPMLGHVLAAAQATGASRVSVVHGPGAASVADYAARAGAEVFEQAERLGTAHAVLAARSALTDPADDVLVVYGDTPLVSGATLGRMREALANGADLAVLGFTAADPRGYGRLIVRDGALAAIREQRDASTEERAVTLCNGGAMAFRGPGMLALLDRIGKANAQGEYYLTDAVALANTDGKSVVVVETGEDEVRGVNDRLQLAVVEALWQLAARQRAMAGGATLVAPETVHFAYDTVTGSDVLIEQNVVFGPGVVLEDGSTVRAFSHLEGARIATGAMVGPYARLRPGAEIGARARIGNFVEIKNAGIGEGTKVNHLSYVGDASVGPHSNLGAGTITCNYDGIGKHRTEIGAGVFIGSNSALVAPLRIGDEAYIGSGSVITEDVSPGALAIGRGRQIEKPGWVARFRARMAAARQSTRQSD
ncbi:MAG: bifunctional UDP-N-acetylglucosamine diphosphorylase/glucosamine-1-phosphate N-acetyltransferase GlmU [Bauldia sp.]|nr:bifunctional UDP-N-acetylglucosamine diphosphorylase/glucosamine-1-phosphate N-acetyltransferase GlmU [Bauldia sp.]